MRDWLPIAWETACMVVVALATVAAANEGEMLSAALCLVATVIYAFSFGFSVCRRLSWPRR